MNFDTKPSTRELHSFHNSLAILLKAVEGHKTTVDLRNESFVYGTVEQADGFMNVVMKDCVFTDPRGDRFPFDTFFVHARNIRCVQIPANIPIIPAIRHELESINPMFRRDNVEVKQKKTFREKRIKDKLKDDKAAVQEILSKQETSDSERL
ncbi:U7 snRNA-associated Sm-like protein LSm10 [Fopius arisanus]|uniref:U7 snRNA-associated Sm-like protein LSm10 n=1 Tax=Fopius arisanus TaxID=64838 RepID=A0A9R1TSD6_9HYME|nr:PREDICTED: U7 snRNA-associated Sm-like protein LSm10 [Fopius arisanus]